MNVRLPLSITSLTSSTSFTPCPLSPLFTNSSQTPSSKPFVLIFFQKTPGGEGRITSVPLSLQLLLRATYDRSQPISCHALARTFPFSTDGAASPRLRPLELAQILPPQASQFAGHEPRITGHAARTTERTAARSASHQSQSPVRSQLVLLSTVNCRLSTSRSSTINSHEPH